MSDGVKTRLANRVSALLEGMFPDGCAAHVNGTSAEADMAMERAAGMLALDRSQAVRSGRVFLFASEGDHGVAVTAVEAVDAAEKRAERRAAREAAVAASVASIPTEEITQEPKEAAASEAKPPSERIVPRKPARPSKPLMARRKGAPRK